MTIPLIRTYLKLWFSSEGELPSRVTSMLVGMGFKPTPGEYDYVYIWRKKPSVDDLVQLAEQVQQTLKGTNTYFKLESG